MRLSTSWPLPGGIHASHVAAQSAWGSQYLVAWAGQEPQGSLVLRLSGYEGERARAAHPDAVEICHLHVRPAYRGRGVGTALIAAAERTARELGHALVALGVDEDNPDARRLYERLGYVATGIHDVCEYDWTAPDGTVHHARESNEMLLKRL